MGYTQVDIAVIYIYFGMMTRLYACEGSQSVKMTVLL